LEGVYQVVRVEMLHSRHVVRPSPTIRLVPPARRGGTKQDKVSTAEVMQGQADGKASRSPLVTTRDLPGPDG
jgi:hypothetical protein